MSDYSILLVERRVRDAKQEATFFKDTLGCSEEQVSETMLSCMDWGKQPDGMAYGQTGLYTSFLTPQSAQAPQAGQGNIREVELNSSKLYKNLEEKRVSGSCGATVDGVNKDLILTSPGGLRMRVKNTTISHGDTFGSISLWTSNLQQTKNFFQSILGAPITQKTDTGTGIEILSVQLGQKTLVMWQKETVQNPGMRLALYTNIKEMEGISEKLETFRGAGYCSVVRPMIKQATAKRGTISTIKIRLADYIEITIVNKT